MHCGIFNVAFNQHHIPFVTPTVSLGALCVTTFVSGPREQQQQRTNVPLFDGVQHSKHTVNGSHATNTTESHLKNMLAAATTPLDRKYWAHELRQFVDRNLRNRVIIQSWLILPSMDPLVMTGAQDKTAARSHSLPNAGHARSCAAFNSTVSLFIYFVVIRFYPALAAVAPADLAVPPHSTPPVPPMAPTLTPLCPPCPLHHPECFGCTCAFRSTAKNTKCP